MQSGWLKLNLSNWLFKPVCDQYLVCITAQHRNPEPKNSRANWFHGTLERNEALPIFEQNGFIDGMYLVRFSVKSNNHVLTMCWNKKMLHYQILKQVFFDSYSKSNFVAGNLLLFSLHVEWITRQGKTCSITAHMFSSKFHAEHVNIFRNFLINS